MNDRELAIECVKLATPLVGPSVNDRFKEVAKVSKLMYAHINSMTGEALTVEEPSDKQIVGTLHKPRKS